MQRMQSLKSFLFSSFFQSFSSLSLVFLYSNISIVVGFLLSSASKKRDLQLFLWLTKMEKMMREEKNRKPDQKLDSEAKWATSGSWQWWRYQRWETWEASPRSSLQMIMTILMMKRREEKS